MQQRLVSQVSCYPPRAKTHPKLDLFISMNGRHSHSKQFRLEQQTLERSIQHLYVGNHNASTTPHEASIKMGSLDHTLVMLPNDELASLESPRRPKTQKPTRQGRRSSRTRIPQKKIRPTNQQNPIQSLISKWFHTSIQLVIQHRQLKSY